MQKWQLVHMYSKTWVYQLLNKDSLININAVNIPETGTARREGQESIRRWKLCRTVDCAASSELQLAQQDALHV